MITDKTCRCFLLSMQRAFKSVIWAERECNEDCSWIFRYWPYSFSKSYILLSLWFCIHYCFRLFHWNNSEAQSALRQAPSSSPWPSHPWSQCPGAGDTPLSLHASLLGTGRAGAHQTAPLLPRQARPKPQLWHCVPRPAAHKWSWP